MVVCFKQTEKEGKMSTRKAAVPDAPRDVLQAKPKKLKREQFERLYKSVTKRISRTLAILAK